MKTKVYYLLLFLGAFMIETYAQSDLKTKNKIESMWLKKMNLEKDTAAIVDSIKEIQGQLESVEKELKYEKLISDKLKQCVNNDTIDSLNNVHMVLSTQPNMSFGQVQCSIDNKVEKPSTKEDVERDINIRENDTLYLRCKLESNLEVLTHKYSSVSLVELYEMKRNLFKYRCFNEYSDYEKRIEIALQNKNLYDNAYKSISVEYNVDTIYYLYKDMERLLAKSDKNKIKLNKLSEEQYAEFSSLMAYLSRYRGALQSFQQFILKVNERVEKFRECSDKQNCKKEIEKIFNQHENTDKKFYEKYLPYLPYIQNKFNEYRRDLRLNPLEETSVEKEIMKYKL